MSSFPDNNFGHFLHNGGQVGSNFWTDSIHGVGFNGALPALAQPINSATATLPEVIAVLVRFGLVEDTAP